MLSGNGLLSMFEPVVKIAKEIIDLQVTMCNSELQQFN